MIQGFIQILIWFEIEDEVIEILVFIDNDVNVAFVMFENILDDEIKRDYRVLF